MWKGFASNNVTSEGRALEEEGFSKYMIEATVKRRIQNSPHAILDPKNSLASFCQD